MILRKQNSCWTRFLVIDPFVELFSSIFTDMFDQYSLQQGICISTSRCICFVLRKCVISIVNAFLTVRVEPEGRILLHELSHVGCQS